MSGRLVGSAALVNDGSTWKITLEPHAMIVVKRLFPKVAKGELSSIHLAHNETTAVDIRWFFERYPVAITTLILLCSTVPAHVTLNRRRC